jgi:hypothetical protein
VVSFGITNKLREQFYGSVATQNQQGLFYNFGTGAGILASLALNPAGAGSALAKGAAAAYSVAGMTYGALESTGNILKGEGTVWDALNFLPALQLARASKGSRTVSSAIVEADAAVTQVAKKTECFVAGTEIQTLDGTKNIEDIQVGDWVLSDDPTTVGEIEYKQVLNTFVKETSNLVDIYIDGEKITTTEEHPFWVPDVGWVAARDLHAGTLLQTKYESWLDVDRVEKYVGLTTVYNFEVAGFHTYFVSDLGLLVHNTCGVEFRAALAEGSNSRLQLDSDKLGLTQNFIDIERIARESNELGNPRVIGTWGNDKNPTRRLIEDVNYYTKRNANEVAGYQLEFRERVRILNEGGTIDLSDLRADIISPSLKEAIQAKHVSGTGFDKNLKDAVGQLAGNKFHINGEIAPEGYKAVALLELGRDSTYFSSSRDELAKIIDKNLKSLNKPRSQTNPEEVIWGPYQQYRQSVEEVRVVAGNNRHIFIRGIDF